MRVSVVGPVYPYRGGIAHHTALLARHLAERHSVQMISFVRQYPRWLLHGRTDLDPSQRPLQVAAEYLLDPLNPVTWWQVGRRVAEWGPDLLILPWWVTYWGPAWFTLAHLVRRRSRAKVLFLCHNVLPHENNLLDHLVARAVLTQGDLYLAQSSQQMHILQDLAPGRPVTWVPLPSFAEIGADDRGDSAHGPPRRSSLELPAGRPILLFFGFVRPYKGLDVLLEALPAVLQEIPAHLLVVGEIWGDQAHYQAQIERLGLTGHVTLTDEYIPDERLAEFFGLADVVVLPYLSATQSAVVPLAFSFGLPVIASRVGGLADAVQEGSTGLLVPPADPPALAQAIVRFFREDLGPAMRARVRLHEPQGSWQCLIDAIESLASQV